MPSNVFPDKSYTLHPISDFIAAGTVSLVYAFGEDRFIKRCPEPSDEFANQAYRIEVRAYERLGDHPRIATLWEVSSKGLILERGECLRRKLKGTGRDEIALPARLQWAREAAEGLWGPHTWQKHRTRRCWFP